MVNELLQYPGPINATETSHVLLTVIYHPGGYSRDCRSRIAMFRYGRSGVNDPCLSRSPSIPKWYTSFPVHYICVQVGAREKGGWRERSRYEGRLWGNGVFHLARRACMGTGVHEMEDVPVGEVTGKQAVLLYWEKPFRGKM